MFDLFNHFIYVLIYFEWKPNTQQISTMGWWLGSHAEGWLLVNYWEGRDFPLWLCCRAILAGALFFRNCTSVFPKDVFLVF